MQLWLRPWWPYPQFMLALGWKILVQFAKVGLPVYLLRQLSSPWYSTEKYNFRSCFINKIPNFWELTQLKMYAFGINIVFCSSQMTIPRIESDCNVLRHCFLTNCCSWARAQQVPTSFWRFTAWILDINLALHSIYITQKTRTEYWELLFTPWFQCMVVIIWKEKVGPYFTIFHLSI